ncbi:MAG: hypothetical protein HWE27_09420 [Gammaproteobacteria bacterium]|nr:hypothetical protein [Gammaproteobacteria bacterium]
MKRLTFIASVLLLVVGCAGTQSGSNMTMASNSNYEIDKERMYLIEQAARNSDKNVRVIWVNPPRKKSKN